MHKVIWVIAKIILSLAPEEHGAALHEAPQEKRHKKRLEKRLEKSPGDKSS